MAFHVGQFVACVDDKCSTPILADEKWLLCRGTIYTIRSLENVNGIDCVSLEEIRPSDEQYDEGWFWARRFRPVEPKRIQVFRSMLINPHKRVEVEASDTLRELKASVRLADLELEKALAKYERLAWGK